MALCRLGPDCDVYVFMGDDAWVCCLCALAKAERQYFATDEEIVAHLQAHIAAGHKVPADVFEGLEEEK